MVTPFELRLLANNSSNLTKNSSDFLSHSSISGTPSLISLFYHPTIETNHPLSSEQISARSCEVDNLIMTLPIGFHFNILHNLFAFLHCYLPF